MSDRILLAHGSGGKLAHDLIEKVLVKPLSNPLLDRLDDSAVFSCSGRLAFTTDSYVVSPTFFPGGDIGKLAVCGTVNDLSMVGATPLYLSLAFIIEEGLSLDELERVLVSVQAAAREAQVQIITGDTKVVNRGSADKLFVNTAGVGTVPEEVDISGSNARPGDKVILSGTIGDHGIAVQQRGRRRADGVNMVGVDLVQQHRPAARKPPREELLAGFVASAEAVPQAWLPLPPLRQQAGLAYFKTGRLRHRRLPGLQCQSPLTSAEPATTAWPGACPFRNG